MRSFRQPEATILGYRIERILERDHLGIVHACWYEVLRPADGSVLASYPSRTEAERFILDRELAGVRLAARRYAA